MYRKVKNLLVISCLVVVSFTLANVALASQLNVGLEFAQSTGLGSEDPRVIVANIINIILGFLGIITVVLIIYAVVAGATTGDSEKAAQTKNVLIAAVIGLIIILASFALTRFILNSIIQSTS